ncbi:MAG: hypothetical protein LBL95_01355 [Deltaproteobacteria bacterium]|jgi:hypothetical protein|nr:hypothetical protein [Deltaproteobacteria bacterium]
MANAPKDVCLFQGGTPEFGNFFHCSGTPQYSGPPFGGPRYPDKPLGNNPYDAAAPRGDFAASAPMWPRVFEKQRNAFLDSRPADGNVIQLVLVPVNHYFWGVRVDVAEPDEDMAGATVSIAGQLFAEKDAESGEFTLTEDPAFALAAQAQGLANIPLDVRGSYVLWMGRVAGGGIVDGTVTGGAVVDGSVAGGYVMPYYVAPVEKTTSGATPEKVLLERGALVLGLKIESPPSNSDVKIWHMRHPVFMSAVITAFNFKDNV